MSEIIITKQCSHCKIIKSLSEFRHNKTAKDGFHNQCKACEAEYRRTENGKASRKASDKRRMQTTHAKQLACQQSKRFRQSAKGQAYYRMYYKSEKRKLADKKYRSSASGKMNQRKQQIKYNIRYPERNRTRDAVKYAVKYAVKKARLPKIKTQNCILCQKQAKVYHHREGYDKAHRLHLTPVCYLCHKFLHANDHSLQFGGQQP